MIRIIVQAGPIDAGSELAAVEGAGVGAVASFTGLVRADDGVTRLELEHYPGMTEAMLRNVADAAVTRWGLVAVSIVHRVGAMVPGDRVVFIAAAAAHRAAALEACAAMIDSLKVSAPFWKRERRDAGAAWVEARDGDLAAAARWDAD